MKSHIGIPLSFYSMLRLAVVLLCLHSSLAAYKKENFPDPLRDPLQCGGSQDKRTFVCDPKDIFTSEQRHEIDAIVKKVENSTECICKKCLPEQHGFKIGIAIVDSVPLQGKGIGTAMVEYGDYIRKKWRIGKCDDDVLVLLSMGDKKIYASRGTKVAKILTGDVLREIYEGEGDNLYSFDGLKNVLLGFMTAFKDSQDPTKQNMPYIIGGIVGGVILIILIIACIIVNCCRKKRHPKKVSYKKRQSDEMAKKIAAFEQPSHYPKHEYSKVGLEEPDYSSNV